MIIDRIYEWARIEPAKPALIHNDAVIDYISFAKAIETFRRFLERQNLPAGTIAIVLVNHLADAWALVPALRALGLTTVHVQLLAQAKALGLKNVSCVVTTAREQSDYNLDRNPLDGAKLIVVSKPDLAAARTGDLQPLPPSNHPHGGHILYTSGTTGALKKLLWDSAQEDVRSAARCRFQGFDKKTVAHIVRYEQQTGIGWKVPLAIWQSGGCVVIDQRPERYERFFRHAANHARMTPRVFRQLVTADQFDLPPSTACEIWIGGGVIGADVISKALARFGDAVHIYHNYSSTERTLPALASRIAHPNDALWLEPTADRAIQIVDDSGRECLSGQEGDVRIQATELDWQGYLDDEETTSKVFRDGFFYPGDRGVRRADGRIRILGRVVDVLNVQGEKLAVAPIGQRIRQYLQVDEVCVFSRQNDAGLDELVIAIQSHTEPTREKLDAISREFNGFEKIHFPVLREFPRTETGLEKVHRTALRALVFSEPITSRP